MESSREGKRTIDLLIRILIYYSMV